MAARATSAGVRTIRIEGPRFTDEQGRTLMLRGVNLGGSSKVPRVPDGATWRRDSLLGHRDVSFVGRPFPLEEADEHFARLARWGFTFLRFLVTWEAIEHAGPGIYDEEYLDYVRAVLEKAAEHGISVFIDPHQDCWSRFTGGDGAPGWTLEVVGFDLEALGVTGAALTHQGHGDPFPRMIWPTNYAKLANLTMWTLFFGGDMFAPKTAIDGVPAQEYLQSHYIGAIRELASRVADLPNVVGFDTLNEPGPGLIGLRDLTSGDTFPLKLGESPTPWQAMLLGAGLPQEVGVYELRLTGFKRTGVRLVNEERTSAWRPDAEDVWRANGVWEVDANSEPRLLRPNHFASVGDRDVDLVADCLRPVFARYTAAIRDLMPSAAIFVEGPANAPSEFGPLDIPNAVHAPHWYDALTLLRKTYSPHLAVDVLSGKVVFGRKRVRASFARQIAGLIRMGTDKLGGVPTIIGEVGIPFDLDGKHAYATGDFRSQMKALDASMSALEASRANFTVWNYTADNTNARGEGWNDEDFSLFSRDQQTDADDLDSGGRALEAAVRPYPRAVPGELVRLAFDFDSRTLEVEFRHDPGVTAPCELFVPDIQYPHGYDVVAPHGKVELRAEEQRLLYTPTEAVVTHSIRLTPRG